MMQEIIKFFVYPIVYFYVLTRETIKRSIREKERTIKEKDDIEKAAALIFKNELSGTGQFRLRKLLEELTLILGCKIHKDEIDIVGFLDDDRSSPIIEYREHLFGIDDHYGYKGNATIVFKCSTCNRYFYKKKYYQALESRGRAEFCSDMLKQKEENYCAGCKTIKNKKGRKNDY